MKKIIYYFLILISSLLFYSFCIEPQVHSPLNNIAGDTDSSKTEGKNYLPFKGNSNSIYTNINVSRDSFPQNEPSVKISRKNPSRIVAAWRDFRNGTEPADRRVGYSYSTDGGMTWSSSALLSSFNSYYIYSSDPVVCVDTIGNFYISTISINKDKSNSLVTVYKSTDEGVTFEQKFNVSPHPDSINYGDDKAFITCDMVDGSPYKNTLYVVWSSDKESIISKSTNGGLNWSERKSIVQDGGGYALAPAIGLNGEIYIAWLGWIKGNSYGLYVSKSTNGGANFKSDFICKVTSGSDLMRFPSIATDVSKSKRSGFVYLTWNNKSSLTDDEDIYFCSSSNRGETWSSAIKLIADSLNIPKKYFWPWVTVNNYGNIYIIFYNARNISKNNSVEAYFAKSTDGGTSFQNTLLSSVLSTMNYKNADIRFGDYIGIDSWHNKIIPVWTDERSGGFNSEIYSSVFSDTSENIINISGNLPVRLNLVQYYHGSSFRYLSIKLEIPAISFENFYIYNLLGSNVSVLVKENQLNEMYLKKRNTINLINGVDLCKINFGFNLQVGKLLQIR